MCPHCRAFITTKDRVCPYCNEKVASRAVDRRSDSPILGLIPAIRFNTVLILLVNFGIYIAMTIFTMNMSNGEFASSIDGRVLILFGAKLPFGDPLFAWWRLVTAGFLHLNLFHILMNSWVLFDLGPQVEELYGASRMWTIYFCSNFAGFFLSAWLSRATSGGASAALCGLIGAMIAIGVAKRHPMAHAIRAVYVRWAVYILIFSLFGGVDLMAHVGGGLAGFAIGYIADLPGLVDRPVERLWRVCAWFCVLLTVVSFLKLFLWYRQITS